MRSKTMWTALWLGSVILAWFLGSSRSEGMARVTRTGSEPSGEQLVKTVLRGRPTRDADGTAGKGRGEGGDHATARPSEPEPIHYDEIKTAEEFSRQAMAFIDAQLRRGPEGHRALLLTFAEWTKRESQLEMLFAKDMNELPRLIYPWIRMMVRRESDVVAFVDTVFATAAETPEWFNAIDPDSLSLITDVIGPILPGMTSDQTIARIRKNLATVLAKGKSALPESIADNYDTLSELYDAWAGPLSVDEARGRILDPSLTAEEKLKILKRTPAEAVAGIELAAILGPALRGDNEWEAIEQIKRFDLGARDLLVLDEAVYESITKSEYAGWIVGEYIDATKRATWEQQRPFVEEGVRRGGKTRTAMLKALPSIEKVPEQYVRQCLALSDLSEGERATLEGLLAELDE